LIALQLASYIEDQFVEWEPTGNVITPAGGGVNVG
jgi:hypothetical protein